MLVQVGSNSLDQLWQVLGQKTNGGKMKLYYLDEVQEKINIQDQDDYDLFLEEEDDLKKKLFLESEIESDTEYLPKLENKLVYDFNGLEVSGISDIGASDRLREEELDQEREAIILKHQQDIQAREADMQRAQDEIQQAKQKLKQEKQRKEQARLEREAILQKAQQEEQEASRVAEERRQRLAKELREEAERKAREEAERKAREEKEKVGEREVKEERVKRVKKEKVKEGEKEGLSKDLERLLEGEYNQQAIQGLKDKAQLKAMLGQLKRLKQDYRADKAARQAIKQKKKLLKKHLKPYKTHSFGRKLSDKINQQVKQHTSMLKEELLNELRSESVSINNMNENMSMNMNEKMVMHAGVACDGCQQCPIQGVRYKCAECGDYDLCQICEQKGLHEHHYFIKMKKALPRGDQFYVQSVQMPPQVQPQMYNRLQATIQQQMQQQMDDQQHMQQTFHINSTIKQQQPRKKEEPLDLSKAVTIKQVEQVLKLFNHSKEVHLKITVQNTSDVELKGLVATLHLKDRKKKHTKEIALGDLPSGLKEFTLIYKNHNNHLLFDRDAVEIKLGSKQQNHLASTLYVLTIDDSFSNRVINIYEKILSFFDYDQQFKNQKKKIIKLISRNSNLCEEDIIDKFINKFIEKEKKN